MPFDEYIECKLCGGAATDNHHIYGGVAYRKKSTKYGFIVPLCRACHTGDNGVHHNRTNNLKLKRWAQAQFEQEHSREEFRAIFGKSYIDEEET